MDFLEEGEEDDTSNASLISSLMMNPFGFGDSSMFPSGSLDVATSSSSSSSSGLGGVNASVASTSTSVLVDSMSQLYIAEPSTSTVSSTSGANSITSSDVHDPSSNSSSTTSSSSTAGNLSMNPSVNVSGNGVSVTGHGAASGAGNGMTMMGAPQISHPGIIMNNAGGMAAGYYDQMNMYHQSTGNTNVNTANVAYVDPSTGYYRYPSSASLGSAQANTSGYDFSSSQGGGAGVVAPSLSSHGAPNVAGLPPAPHLYWTPEGGPSPVYLNAHYADMYRRLYPQYSAPYVMPAGMTSPVDMSHMGYPMNPMMAAASVVPSSAPPTNNNTSTVSPTSSNSNVAGSTSSTSSATSTTAASSASSKGMSSGSTSNGVSSEGFRHPGSYPGYADMGYMNGPYTEYRPEMAPMLRSNPNDPQMISGGPPRFGMGGYGAPAMYGIPSAPGYGYSNPSAPHLHNLSGQGAPSNAMGTNRTNGNSNANSSNPNGNASSNGNSNGPYGMAGVPMASSLYPAPSSTNGYEDGTNDPRYRTEYPIPAPPLPLSISTPHGAGTPTAATNPNNGGNTAQGVPAMLSGGPTMMMHTHVGAQNHHLQGIHGPSPMHAYYGANPTTLPTGSVLNGAAVAGVPSSILNSRRMDMGMTGGSNSPSNGNGSGYLGHGSNSNLGGNNNGNNGKKNGGGYSPSSPSTSSSSSGGSGSNNHMHHNQHMHGSSHHHHHHHGSASTGNLMALGNQSGLPHSNSLNNVTASALSNSGNNNSSNGNLSANGNGNNAGNNPNVVRDPLVEEFRSTYGKSRQWGLPDLTGHIVAFCQDQHGSRFIQQKLEVCSDQEKQLVFEEILPSASLLMTDVFGNYVLQKLFEFGTPEQCDSLSDLLRGEAVNLSMQMYGCRVVQKALEYVSTHRLVELVQEFEVPATLLNCVHDANGNHVIQKCIEIVSKAAREAPNQESANYLNSRIQFILDAFHGKVKELSSHPYGCRVVQRILEHCCPAQKNLLLEELRLCFSELVQDCYGNYVIQFVMQHGWDIDRVVLMKEVQTHLLDFSQHKFASNVVEKCLQFANKKDRDDMIWKIINVVTENNGNNGAGRGADGRPQSVLEAMVRDPYANYVVQKVIDMADDKQRSTILKYVKDNIAQLRRYTYGKHIILRLEKITNEKF